MFEVRKNIQEPKQKGRPRIYPFDMCGAGDGFEVPADKITSVRSCLAQWKSVRPGMFQRWITRRNENGSYTIKRIY